MKNKFLFLIALIIVTLTVSGCNEILGKENQILDHQSADEGDENIDSDSESNETEIEEVAESEEITQFLDEAEVEEYLKAAVSLQRVVKKALTQLHVVVT